MERALDVATEDHAQEIRRTLGRLRNVLHDHQYTHVKSVADDMIQTGPPALACVTYLHSVERNLMLANGDREPVITYECRTCLDHRGWVPTDSHGHGTLKPCKDCRPMQYELWSRDHLDCRLESCRVCLQARSDAGVPLASTATTVRPPPSADDERDFI